MAPVQIGSDGQLVPLGGPVVSGPQLPPPGGAATQGVRLSLLIEFLLQRTYHEITLLAELWVAISFVGPNANECSGRKS